MNATPEPPQYLDMAGIAERLGVKPASVRTYNTRAAINRRAGTENAWDMPEPSARFAGRPVWLESTIEEWIARRPGTNTEAATAARKQQRTE